MTAEATDRAATDAALADLIRSGGSELGAPLSSSQVDLFVAYIRLIERWNGTYNLTAIRDPKAMAVHHILDCLAVVAPLRRRGLSVPGHRLLDVGSGAGLPGLAIAAMEPHMEIVCVDSVGKKAAFIAEASSRLGLRNASALHSRVESMAGPRFDIITSRAFSALGSFFALTRHLLGDSGTWLAMKAKRPDAEMASIEGLTFHVEPIVVPGLEAERCLVWAQQASQHSLSRNATTGIGP